jgi:hypothetical protein
MPEARSRPTSGIQLVDLRPHDGGRSMCADLLNWRLIATAASRLRLQRPASLRGGMLGCFRCLEAPEQQPEGEQDDLERCDGKEKELP